MSDVKEKMKLSKYVMMARLWVVDYEEKIKEVGVAHTYDGLYDDVKKLHKAVSDQVRFYYDNGVFENDISIRKAIDVLSGRDYLNPEEFK